MRVKVWIPCDDSPWHGALPGEPVWLTHDGLATLTPTENRGCGSFVDVAPRRVAGAGVNVLGTLENPGPGYLFKVTL